MEFKMWDKESSLGGWSRIMASVGQLGTAAFIGIQSSGETLIASGHDLYAQVILTIGAAITAWSKLRSSVLKK